MNDPLIQRLRAARVARRMSQDQVAARIGVTRQAINNWEIGHNSISLRNLHAWAYALDHTIVAVPNSEPSTVEPAADTAVGTRPATTGRTMADYLREEKQWSTSEEHSPQTTANTTAWKPSPRN